MLHYQTVYPQTLELLKKLMHEEALMNFSLAGGTALSLQCGHRISVDLDFFTDQAFNPSYLYEELKIESPIVVTNISKNTLNASVWGIKLDFIRHHYPYIQNIKIIDGIRLYGLKDIAAMKLNSTTNRGARKDFYDLYELLSHFTLLQMLDWFSEKYGNSLKMQVIKSLVYFNDADLEPDPIQINTIKWEDVKKEIVIQVNKYIANQ